MLLLQTITKLSHSIIKQTTVAVILPSKKLGASHESFYLAYQIKT